MLFQVTTNFVRTAGKENQVNTRYLVGILLHWDPMLGASVSASKRINNSDCNDSLPNKQTDGSTNQKSDICEMIDILRNSDMEATPDMVTGKDTAVYNARVSVGNSGDTYLADKKAQIALMVLKWTLQSDHTNLKSKCAMVDWLNHVLPSTWTVLSEQSGNSLLCDDHLMKSLLSLRTEIINNISDNVAVANNHINVKILVNVLKKLVKLRNTSENGQTASKITLNIAQRVVADATAS